MIEFNKILVPIDFSEPSRKALTYGVTLATQFKAKLVLAHVVPESSALSYAFPTESFAIEEEQRKTATKNIQQMVPAARASTLDVQTLVRTGRIEAELLRIVKEESIDLVVMGTHGRRYPGRWFIGSVAERMLRKVPVPVLTVSHIEDERHAVDVGLVALNRILYATDLSDSSSLGMKYAVELARGTGAQLTVVHVVEYLSLVYEAAAYIDNERNERIEDMRNRLHEAVARETPAGMPVETLVVDGKPYHEILAEAGRRGMDMIVINVQSKSVLERAFLGSTAERVVRLATVPVFSVPASSAI